MELIVGGIALLVAGIAGGQIAFLGAKFPKLTKPASRAFIGLGLLVILGGAAQLILERSDKDFRVTAAELRTVSSYVGACPGTQLLEGRITTKGGDGEVTYRLFTVGGYRSELYARPVQRDGTFGFEVPLPVGRPADGSSVGRDTAYVRVNSPNSKDSPPSPFQITCTEDR